MAGILFEDIFDVKDIDPEGKKFDRGEWGRRSAPGLLGAAVPGGSCALPPPGVSPRPPASPLRPSRWRGPLCPVPSPPSGTDPRAARCSPSPGVCPRPRRAPCPHAVSPPSPHSPRSAPGLWQPPPSPVHPFSGTLRPPALLVLTLVLSPVSRLHCESESFKMDLILDVNIQIYPVDLGKTWVYWAKMGRDRARLERCWCSKETKFAANKQRAFSDFLEAPLLSPSHGGCVVLHVLAVLGLSWVLFCLSVRFVWGRLWPIPQRCWLVKLPQLVANEP